MGPVQDVQEEAEALTFEQREQKAHQLKDRLTDYVESITTRSQGSKYKCPLCGSGNGQHKTGAFSIDADTGKTTWTCFSCDEKGDLFDLIGKYEKIEKYTDKINRVLELYGNEQGGVKAKVEKAQKPVPDTTEFIRSTQAAVHNTDYLQQRGFTEETIERFGLGLYDGSWDQDTELISMFGKVPLSEDAIIIPFPGTRYFAARYTRHEDELKASGKSKYWKPDSEVFHKQPLYNAPALHNAGHRPVFVTEGAFDAMSITQAGGLAVALFGVGHSCLLDELSRLQDAPKLIISMDSDERGQKATETLKQKLEEAGYEYMIKSITDDPFISYKDANEYMIEDADGFISAVSDIEASADQDRAEYLQGSAGSLINGLWDKIREGKNTPCIGTGFRELDKTLDGGLYEGLYIIGAGSSIGKTSLMLQLADNIAASGSDVLYFSLEMSANELIAKSISRKTRELTRYSSFAKTTRGIMSSARYAEYMPEELDLIHRAIDEYRKKARTLFIREGMGDIGVQKIRDMVRKHEQHTGNKPVVFIDYLQILAPYNDRMNEKQSIDKNVTELKRISVDFGVPVIAISSFNRAAYKASADQTAFKESGAIEYASDVLMALQPSGIETGSTTKASDNNQETDRKYRLSPERSAELVILKNRNGQAYSTVKFRYYALFNLFKEIVDSQVFD